MLLNKIMRIGKISDVSSFMSKFLSTINTFRIIYTLRIFSMRICYYFILFDICIIYWVLCPLKFLHRPRHSHLTRQSIFLIILFLFLQDSFTDLQFNQLSLIRQFFMFLQLFQILLELIDGNLSRLRILPIIVSIQ